MRPVSWAGRTGPGGDRMVRGTRRLHHQTCMEMKLGPLVGSRGSSTGHTSVTLEGSGSLLVDNVHKPSCTPGQGGRARGRTACPLRNPRGSRCSRWGRGTCWSTGRSCATGRRRTASCTPTCPQGGCSRWRRLHGSHQDCPPHPNTWCAQSMSTQTQIDSEHWHTPGHGDGGPSLSTWHFNEAGGPAGAGQGAPRLRFLGTGSVWCRHVLARVAILVAISVCLVRVRHARAVVRPADHTSTHKRSVSTPHREFASAAKMVTDSDANTPSS
jgi:hypothetical protein